jgi:hypothetical protein
MIKVVSILFMVLGLSVSDKSNQKHHLPREGIIYSFTGCTINYDADIIWCLASNNQENSLDKVGA